MTMAAIVAATARNGFRVGVAAKTTMAAKTEYTEKKIDEHAQNFSPESVLIQ